MVYPSTTKRIGFDPLLIQAHIENLFARATDLNARLAPLESNYVALSANAGGAVNTNETQAATIDALQNQLLALAAYVTDAALASIPTSTTANYANFPPFSVRALAIEQRLNAISPDTSAIDYGAGPNTATGDLMPVAIGKLASRLTAQGFDPGQLGADVATALAQVEYAVQLAEAAFIPGSELFLTLTGSPAPAVVGSPYSFIPGVAYASGAVVFTLYGSLPAGLAFDPTTGAITGIPTSATTFTGSIGAVDDKSSVQLAVTFVVAGPQTTPLLNNLAILPATATVGTAATLTISGATAGSTITGTVPDGMTLNSVARTITGAPTTAGSFSVILTETLEGAVGSPKQSTVGVTVAPASVTPIPGSFFSDPFFINGMFARAA